MTTLPKEDLGTYPHKINWEWADKLTDENRYRLHFDHYAIDRVAILINYRNKPKLFLRLALIKNWLRHRLIPILRQIASWTVLTRLEGY